MFRELFDRLFYRGYLAAEAASTRLVVRRFSRGNTSIQQGRYVTAAEASDLLARGDRAAERLRRRIVRVRR